MDHARPRRAIAAGVAALAALLLAAATLVLAPVQPAGAAGTFTAKGSIEQVYTYGHPSGSTVELLDSGGTVLRTGTADTQGALLFRDLTPGPGYQVREGGTTVSGLTVMDPANNPDQSFYEASRGTLSSGFGYITTRDGTKLSANVTFPNDGSSGPWPVVVDYSGYDPSQPGQTPQEAALYPYLGYVVVGVNLRGTTCSGGAFWFFEDAVRTDGYDVIETLAHQSWSNGNVGMVGISYSGYSQMPVAATHPPHLKAITPLSPFSDGYRGILYPGGILNKGFALNWALEREADAKPSAHSWVRSRISGGDTTCQQNQVMRLQSQKLSQEITDGRFDDPQYSYLSPGNFASQIQVPTFLETQWQDEQTGGYGAEIASILQAHGTRLRAIFTNGTHVDSLGPEVFMKVAAFVDLYVGERLPTKEGNSFYQNGVADALGPLFGTTITSVPFYWPTSITTYADGLAYYQAQDPIEVRWENGGVVGKEGEPYATLTTTYPAWPPTTAKAERWYLQPDGVLSKTAPTVADTDPRASSSYTYDPTSKRSRTFDGSTGAMWTSHPDVRWNPLAEGKALSFLTPAYTAKTGYLGGGSADLWLRSSAVDTDLEVTLTEVRPDGQEVYIQSGWLRASRRALDPARSTVLRPWETYQAADAAPLPAGQFVPVRIELFPFAHIFRAGSRLRVNIEAPGGNQPFWEFSDLAGTATNQIGHSAGMPSSVVLSQIPDGRITLYAKATAPSCAVSGVTTQSQSLRNQPCRTYLPDRKPTGVAATLQGGAATVSWQAPPTWASGPALTGYKVKVSPGGAVTDVPTTATSASVDLGGQGGPVSFSVAAVYGATVAPYSDSSAALDVPVPTSVTARPGDGTAVVSWKAPASPGATITGYRVTPYLGAVAQPASTFASTALSQTISGLANGSTYTFVVAAIYTTVGAGSAPSAPVVVGAPAAPGFLSATPASHQATVKWWPPSGNGSAVTGYTITPYVGATPQSPRTVVGNVSSYVVTGLDNGTTYTFAVAATNARGTGPAGTTSAVLVNPTAPGAPTSVVAKAGNGVATLTWKAPGSDGGSALTGYVVTPYIGAVAQPTQSFGTGTSQTVTGLTNGSTYTFTVAAVNAVGPSVPSTASGAVTVGAPGAPGFLSVVPGNHQATIKWWAPASNGGPLTGYVITPYIGSVAQTPFVSSSTSNVQTVTGLTNGTTYTFSVAATNAFGTGPATMSPAALVNPTAPAAPTSVSAKTGTASAVVSWKAPSTDGGSAITGYTVTPYLSGVAQAPQAFASAATTQTVTSLTNGGSYTFVVTATNAIGTGPASSASAAITVGVPNAPGFLSATAGAGQVTLRWWAPSGNAGPITGYVITPYIGAVAQAPRLTSTANVQVISGLTPGVTYTFTVAAVNAYGTGAASKSPAATPT